MQLGELRRHTAGNTIYNNIRNGINEDVSEEISGEQFGLFRWFVPLGIFRLSERLISLLLLVLSSAQWLVQISLKDILRVIFILFHRYSWFGLHCLGMGVRVKVPECNIVEEDEAGDHVRESG